MFSITFKTSIELSIPNLKETIVVEEWDKSKRTDEIYRSIENYTKKNDIAIHKIVFRTNSNGNTEKNIFTFTNKKTSNYVYSQKGFKTITNFHDSKKLSTENILGSYALTQAAPKDLENYLASLGLVTHIEKFNIFSFFAGSMFTTTGNLFVVMLFSMILAGFFYKISQRKKYGVIEILGKNVIKESRNDFIIDSAIVIISILFFCLVYPIFTPLLIRIGLIFFIGIFSLSLLTTLVANKSGTISDKIKGEKPYKLLTYANIFVKVVVLIFIVIFSFRALNQLNESKENYKGLSNWSEVENYYQLEFNNTTTLFIDFSNPDKDAKKLEAGKINQKLFPLLVKSEQSGSILASNNEELLSFERTGSPFSIDSHSFMTVNHNFLESVLVIDSKGNRISQLPQDKFYCLIPENEKSNSKKIKEQIAEQIALNQDLFGDPEDSYKGDIELLYIKSDQSIFNFNAENPKYSISTNPIILVLSLQMVGPNIDNWIAEISQGHYLFKNQKEVQEFISNNYLEDEFWGLTAAKDRANEMLQKSEIEYRTASISLFLLIIIFVIVAFYNSLVYVELNKKRLFLQYIFGDSLWMRHHLYYIKMSLITLGVMTTLVIFKNEFLPIALVVFIFEIVLLFITIALSEKRIRLDILKKGD
ncbi:hypothetical protein RAK27_13695 [Carnobacterium maltaromaticum]|uniref:Bacteriocin-associated integral membrane protein n=2 Tax=Carnobacterium maltaromaticum TaxID=2751 RepID=A0AAW9K904_CARML|nr:hypothetical protein [Carnobacterium maltaromaticum]